MQTPKYQLLFDVSSVLYLLDRGQMANIIIIAVVFC